MLERIQETAAYLKGKMHTHPETAIILGTGLGSLAGEITEKYEIKYEDIPNFPVSTVEGHSGKLIFGKLGNKDIMAMQGRFHFYEGYSMKEVTFPVRVMRELGIKTLFVSNASGGTNPDFEIGDLMIITDHINFFPEHPLHGRNIPYGPRFPDMSEAYDKELIRKADAIAAEKGIKVQHGVYIGTQGPTFETPDPGCGCGRYVYRSRSNRSEPLRYQSVRRIGYHGLRCGRQDCRGFPRRSAESCGCRTAEDDGDYEGVD